MITPLDIESVSFKKVPMGYSCAEVDKFLDDIIHDYEHLYKENIEFKDKISMLNDGIQYYKSMESILKNTLILAEKTAEETKASAHVKAEQITKDAEIRATELLQSYQREINGLIQKIDLLKNQFEMYKIKIKQLLISELEMVLNTKIEYDVIDNNMQNKNLDTNKILDKDINSQGSED